MGSALASAAQRAGAEVFIYDKDIKKANEVAEKIGAVFAETDEILKCDYIFLAVKPNIVPIVCGEIGQKLWDGVLVSMAAGVSIWNLEVALDPDRVGCTKKIIRIMPNTPVLCGKGMTVFCVNDYVTEEEKQGFINLMSESGRLDEIPEGQIDAASAVSGCGPAFVYMFIEALADGGVECGLSREQALRFACETVKGAAETVLFTGAHPEALKDAVCSPGGTTISGVHALEEGAFRATSANAVLEAYKKTLSLKK